MSKIIRNPEPPPENLEDAVKAVLARMHGALADVNAQIDSLHELIRLVDSGILENVENLLRTVASCMKAHSTNVDVQALAIGTIRRLSCMGDQNLKLAVEMEVVADISKAMLNHSTNVGVQA
jgi:hypothetical protein